MIVKVVAVVVVPFFIDIIILFEIKTFTPFIVIIIIIIAITFFDIVFLSREKKLGKDFRI
jgi:hypothetical protein